MLVSLRLFLVALPVALLAVSCCGAAESTEGDAANFEVVIRHDDIHRGTLIYHLQPIGLTILLETRHSPSPKELCRSELSIGQASEWSRFLSTIPLNDLAPEYVDPMEDDALMGFTFVIRKAGVASSKIRAVPMPPTELALLCHRINAIVPAGCVPWTMYCGPAE